MREGDDSSQSLATGTDITSSWPLDVKKTYFIVQIIYRMQARNIDANEVAWNSYGFMKHLSRERIVLCHKKFTKAKQSHFSSCFLSSWVIHVQSTNLTC